jgi:hypothetical protein
VAWFGSRVYVGASWTVMRASDGSMTWTEITAANPFPSTIALALSFRNANGVLDARFFAARTLPGLAQTTFLVRDLTIPNATKGWFVLTSSPTPIVPSAIIYWARDANHVSVFEVPIQQLDADGFPIGDAAAQPRPPEPSPPPPIASLRRPPVTDLWVEGVFGDEHARAVLELFRAAQSAPGSLDAAEPFKHVVGLLLDDEAEEFRSSIGELPER